MNADTDSSFISAHERSELNEKFSSMLYLTIFYVVIALAIFYLTALSHPIGTPVDFTNTIPWMIGSVGLGLAAAVYGISGKLWLRSKRTNVGKGLDVTLVNNNGERVDL